MAYWPPPVQVAVQDEEIEDPLARFRKVANVGTSLASKDLPIAPIPTNRLSDLEVLELSETELAELRKQGLYDMMLDALHTVGGRTYMQRVALYDHKTFFSLLGKLAPKDITLGPSQSLLDLVSAASKVPLPPRPVVKDVTGL